MIDEAALDDPTETLLDLREVQVLYDPPRGTPKAQRSKVRAVDTVSLRLKAGETFGIVGESGCGKSTLARAILGLVPLSSGDILFRGKSLSQMTRKERRVYHRSLGVVFQDPYSSLDPRMTIEEIISEPFQVHGMADRPFVRSRVSALLESVGLASDAAGRFPHEFSGGQKQRIGIARALALDPDVLICDEAVSALDVSIQAQILELLGEIKRNRQLAILFISHDLSVVRYISDVVGVMYRGELVEYGPIGRVYDDTGHPYTQRLLDAIPTLEEIGEATQMLPVPSRGGIDAMVADVCRYIDRCPFVRTTCEQGHPELRVPDARDHPDRCVRSGEWQTERRTLSASESGGL